MSRQPYETIEDIYLQLKALGAVRSANEFSTQWLGMNESYLRTLRSKGMAPSARVLARCSIKLRSFSQNMRAHPQPKLRAVGKQVAALADRCVQDIFAEHEV